MGARKWSRSFLSPSPSPPSSPVSRDSPESDDNEGASALQRSSHLNKQLDLSAREDTAVVPDANPFSLSRKRSASQKGKSKSSAGGNIRPAGNVRPASARKAQASVPEDAFERKKGWTNGRGEVVPPVAKSKRKADDDGSCKQIDGNRLSRDAILPLKNAPKPPKPKASASSASSSTAKKKATKKQVDDDISFHRLPRDSEQSRTFPIIAGLARQRSLPTKAEKPEPDINLIVSGHGARVIRTARKPAVSKSQESSSKSSRSSGSNLPSLQRWIPSTPPPPPPSVSENPTRHSLSPASVEHDDAPLAEAHAQRPPMTPPPPLVHAGISGYASSAVTTLKTPSSVRRPVHDPSPAASVGPSHAQLLESMVEQLPQDYNLLEQGIERPEAHLDRRQDSPIPQYRQPRESCLGAPHHSPAPVPASQRLAQFRFQRPSSSAAPSSSVNLSTHLPSDLTHSLPADLPGAAATDHTLHRSASARVPLPPAFSAMPPPEIPALPLRSAPRPALGAQPVPPNLTPKFSSPAQVIRPRHSHARPQPPHTAHPYTSTQPRHGVIAGQSYVGLYRPKPPAPSSAGGKRRLTLAPGRTSYTAGAKVTTWEPTPLSQSRAASMAPPEPQQSAYVPRHLRALQQAAQPASAPPPAPAQEEDEDWDADWRPVVNRA